MLGRLVFCTGCLAAARGLAPVGPFVRPSGTLAGAERCRSSSSGRFFHRDENNDDGAHVAAGVPRDSSKAALRCRRSGAAGAEEEGGGRNRDNDALLGKPAPSVALEDGPAGWRDINNPATAAAAATTTVEAREEEEDAAGLVVQLAAAAAAAAERQTTTTAAASSSASSARTLAMGVMLACSVLLVATPVTVTPSAANAADSSPPQQQQQQQQQDHQPQRRENQRLFGMVEPTPQSAGTPRKARPPPPPIPEGRITILQWCQKNIGRRVPKLSDVETGVRTAADTAEKIRINSGAAPTAQDLRGMAREAVERKLDGFSAASSSSSSSSSGRKRSTAVQGAVASATSAADVQEQAETPPDTPSPSSGSPSATSNVRQEIDAIKEAQAEMLGLQQAPPSTTSTPAEPSSLRPTTPSSPFRVKVPTAAPSWGFKVKLPAMPTFGAAAGDKVVAFTDLASQMEQGTKTDGQPDAADEPRSKVKKRGKTRRADAAVSGATSTAAVDLKAELRAESEKAALLPSSPPQRAKQQQQQQQAPAKYVAPAPLYEPAEEGAPTSSSTPGKGLAVGVPGIGAGGEEKSGAGLEGVTAAARASLEKLDLRDVSQQGGSASEAGVAAILEQGRASLENLQAEADRISAQVASPIADKLSAGGVSKETGRLAGQSAAVGSRLSEAFGRGRDGVLAAVGEAGRALDQGVSTASSSRSAVVVDGLPALKGQASGLSARLLETSGRALSRATGTAGEISDKISGGLTDLAGRWPDILARARSVSARLSSSDDRDGALVGGVTAEEAAAVAVAVAVVAGGVTTAISRSSGGGGGGGVAEKGAEGIGGSGNTGRRGDAVAEQGEERRLQPIGGGGGGDAAGEGGWEGEGAEEEEEEGEGEALQPVGVKLETGATNEGERYGEEAMSASSTLWDMIRGSGTGAGDAVREVSEEDLLERAAELGRELRETAEGLEVLKHEVSALRESIRASDLEGRAKAIGERLASTLEGHATS